MWQRPLGCNSCSAPAGYACEASLLSEISEEWLQKLILVTRPRKWRLFNRKSLPVMMWCATILGWTYLQTQQTLQVFHMFKSKLRFQDIQFHGSFAWSCWPWTSLFNSTSGVGHLMVVEVVDPTLWLKELCLLSLLNHTQWKWHWKEYQNRHSLNNSFLDVSPSHQRSSALMSCLVLVVFRIVWFSKKEKSKRTRNSGRKEETRRGSNMLVVLVGNLEQKLRWKVLGPQQFAKSVLSAFSIEYFNVFQTHWWTKAVGQMFQEAGGFAYEAVANTAASAAAQAAGAARLFKNSFGLDIWSFRISWKPLEIVGKFKYEICSFLRLGSANKLKMTPGERWWFTMIPRISVRIPWGQCGQPNKFNFVAFQMSQELARSYGRSHDLCREKLFDY